MNLRQRKCAVGLFCLRLCLLMLTVIVLAGCGKTRLASTDPIGGDGNYPPAGTKPYTVNGNTYYPMGSSADFSEEGMASWYGPDFHGKTTANGERYDMNAMTAAHKTLPFGTMVKVTSRIDGSSAVVRINDRGPFVPNRIIDVSRSAAVQLNMIAPGTIPVLLETVGSTPGVSRGGDISGRFYIQVGAFTSQENADKLVQGLKGRGHSARTYFAPGVGFWRVQVGPYSGLHAAEAAAVPMTTEFPDNFVVAE